MENLYFLQLQSYYMSNLELIKILNGENEEESKKDWSYNLFHAIDIDWVKQWKAFIGYDKIIEDLKSKRINEINENNRKWITSLIEKNIKGKQPLKKLNNKSIYYSLDSNCTLNDSSNTSNSSSIGIGGSNNIIINSFELISEKAWEIFNEDRNNEENNLNGKLLIKLGKKSIIIKLSEKLYIIECPKNNIINDLKSDLIELKIDILRGNSDNFTNKIVDIIMKKEEKERENFHYENKDFHVYIKKQEKPFFSNISSINNQSSSQENEQININFNNINYINNICVKKYKNTSYINASMFSLSQIKEFAKYFFINEENESKNIKYSDLLNHFRDYINQLWINRNQDYIFKPTLFIESLNKYNINLVTDKEIEPKFFLKEILEYINKELNGKDEEINKKIENSLEEFKNDLSFSYYKKDFQIKYNSIVSEIFYGIFHKKYSCNCENNDIYEKFDIIELNYNNYFNFKNKLNQSNISSSSNISLNESLYCFELDDFIEFYFKQKKFYCEKCKREVIKSIYKYPQVLIFSFNWGNFSTDKGFELEYNKLKFEKEIDLTYFSSRSGVGMKYEFRSGIYYHVINENYQEKKYKRFFTISRHVIDNTLYFYQTKGNVEKVSHFCRLGLIPSILIYESKN